MTACAPADSRFRAACLTALWTADSSRWWCLTAPVRGSRLREAAGKKYCQPEVLSAPGYLRASIRQVHGARALGEIVFGQSFTWERCLGERVPQAD